MKQVRLLGIIFVIVLQLVVTKQVFAAGVISPIQKFSQFLIQTTGNIDLDNNGTNDFINWAPTCGGGGCTDLSHPKTDRTVTVTDTEITGDIFGEGVGWIRLDPNTDTNAYPPPAQCDNSIGVKNTCSGELSGCAWGQNTGWVNFSPSFATGINDPKINTSTGKITGTIWSQNYGWIQLSSPEIPPAPFNNYNPSDGLITTWTPSPSCTTPPPPPPSEGGGFTPVLYVVKNVINTGGGTKLASDFTLHVKKNGIDISGSPFAGSVAPGTQLTPGMGTYTVSEDPVNNYTRSFSGDCDVSGNITIAASGTFTCVVTSTYKPATQIIRGCTDPRATNYNPSANTDNGSCTYTNTAIYGCTVSTAINYNPNATIDDGSCSNPLPQSQYVCSDAIDNDFDGAVDYPNDPGCISPFDNDEENPIPVVDPAGPTDPTGPTGIPGTNVPTEPFSIKSIGKVAAPVAIAISTIGLISTIPGFATRIVNLIISIPFYRRRRPWGIVYDAETKEPIDPAYVTVFNADTGATIDTKITDIHGRYGFLLPVGNYRMTAQKTNYAFPSQKLLNRQSDEVYSDLYFGDVFSVTDTNKDGVVVLNMPMDYLGTVADWNQEEKKRMGLWNFFTRNTKLWSRISLTLFILGFLFSVYALLVYPTMWNIVVFVLYVAFTLLQLVGFGPVTIGTITDTQGNPIPHAVIRVWNAHLGTQIAQRVANEKGQYYLLVSKGDYYITVDVKNASGGFDRIFTSETMKVHHGVINKDFEIAA